MQLYTPLAIGWAFEIASVLILIQGLFFILKFIQRTKRELRKPMYGIFVTMIIYILLSVVMGIMVTKGIGFENPIWGIPPIVGMISAFVLVRSGKKLFLAIQKM
jgi:uncharacterized BrkB/YihY/UPF0761 family membrane protein